MLLEDLESHCSFSRGYISEIPFSHGTETNKDEFYLLFEHKS